MHCAGPARWFLIRCALQWFLLQKCCLLPLLLSLLFLLHPLLVLHLLRLLLLLLLYSFVSYSFCPTALSPSSALSTVPPLSSPLLLSGAVPPSCLLLLLLLLLFLLLLLIPLFFLPLQPRLRLLLRHLPLLLFRYLIFPCYCSCFLFLLPLLPSCYLLLLPLLFNLLSHTHFSSCLWFVSLYLLLLLLQLAFSSFPPYYSLLIPHNVVPLFSLHSPFPLSPTSLHPSSFSSLPPSSPATHLQAHLSLLKDCVELWTRLVRALDGAYKL